MEQNPTVSFTQHAGVVVGITCSDHAVVERLECQHRLALGVFLAQLVAHHPIVFIGDQAVAKQGRETQLTHQRLGELIEGVGQDHHLEALAQPIDELNGAVQRLERGDNGLDIGQLEPMLVEDAQALLHQHVVVGDVTGGGPQGLNAGFLGKGDPDFRNQYPFQVKAGNFHTTLLLDIVS